MERESVLLGRFSHMAVTAGLSVLILFGVIGFQLMRTIRGPEIAESVATTTHATSSPLTSEQQSILESGISTSSKYDLTQIAPAVMGEILGGYAALKNSGDYSPESAQAFADKIAPSLKADVAFKTYTATDIQTDTDISYDRMLTYRKDLGDALKPLMKNTDAEIEVYARYVSTKDTSYLDALRSASRNYDDAIKNAQAIHVPTDAVEYHIGVLNALGKFSSTLKALADHGNDPFAAAALLRTYNAAEQSVYTSFNALAVFYKHKQA